MAPLDNRGESPAVSAPRSESGSWVEVLRAKSVTGTASDKNWRTAIMLSIVLGLFGADRFYVGRPGLGVIKLFTAGGYAVWWIIDVILLSFGEMKDGSGRNIYKR